MKAGTKRKAREAAERAARNVEKRDGEAGLEKRIGFLTAQLAKPYVQEHLYKRPRLQARLTAARRDWQALREPDPNELVEPGVIFEVSP